MLHEEDREAPFHIQADDGTARIEVSFGPGSWGYGDYQVRLEGVTVKAAVTACDLVGPRTLVRFFEDLASDWRGWTGARSWGTIEQQFVVTATCDKLGHVRLLVAMRSGHLETDWLLEFPLMVTAGQLEQIAAEARATFPG